MHYLTSLSTYYICLPITVELLSRYLLHRHSVKQGGSTSTNIALEVAKPSLVVFEDN